MRATLAAVLLVTLMGATDLSAREPQRAPEEARARVQHHLQEVDQLTTYFEGVMGRECPRFGTPAEWREYLDGEVERVVLLLAHSGWVEQLSGSAVVNADQRQAVVCATLAAVNRRLEALLP